MDVILKQELASFSLLRAILCRRNVMKCKNLKEDKVADYKSPIDYVYFISNNNLYAEADSSD